MKVLETLSLPATSVFRSSSHLWHQAKRKQPTPTSPSPQSGSSRFSSFVSLSACLPCITKPPNPDPRNSTNLTSSSSSSPTPSEHDQPLPFPVRVVENLPSRRSSGRTIRKPELVKAPTPKSRPPSPTQPKQPKLDDAGEPTLIITISPSSPSTLPSLPSTPSSTPPSPTTMADRTLQQILTQLRSNPGLSYGEASTLLSKAKILLLTLKAATPGPSPASPAYLALARDVYEQGALFSIRARNPDAFTRYVSQLQPFYELSASVLAPTPASDAERNKVTGLYLLLLLTQGRYSEFHSELETLSTRAKEGGGAGEIEGDRFLGYPIKLERWLMEGSYDRVWKAMKNREVPSEEYGVFSEILTSQIRSEIASSSERAYPSLPLSSTKSLLFLDSEGAVIDFARHRGWDVRDGHIYFPSLTAGAEGEAAEEAAEEKEFSRMVIENALGYARELETIV
ncbi:SAC3/GANP/Nin1/mts3/eIF-3 p25 family-domain-containing protein [Annulohypoxylon truncatum]|uniref:SAC3/GANP/Nin1/mts3/eIF-3 p25 family-domain-containing protein n=1 Tax=Annulohypoxylon truncatum TaxID=327061 RepID=UPI0020082B38|nr:SAC3/GANP/Nin1/mts3/eIF-3 p25 family-domain-containing protein [Annulohypoxylon truncatum]KAI1207788.1 SAC3/GANP/Nin1/mts3/eIF-3 p25 family-domain-containing protein [Annulohypoxylon truncatum]